MAEVVVGTGANKVICSLLADTSEITWATSWGPSRPGGSWEASWLMDLRPDTTHPSLMPGNAVEIWDGPTRVWVGRMTEPERGSPWRLHAKGLPYLAGDFLSLDSVGSSTTIPDTAIDQAVTRGLPWKRPTSISSTAFGEFSNDVARLDGLLNTYAHSVGKRWAVANDGGVSVSTDPTAPQWLLAPGLGALGTTVETNVTHLYVRYVASVSGTPPEPASWGQVESSQAAPVRREDFLDITDLGLVSSARAQTVADAVRSDLNYFGPTAGIIVTSDELTTVGAVPARLGQVKAGEMMRALAVVDQSGNYRVGLTMDLVIGETQYTDGSSVLNINPMRKVPRTYAEVMASMPPERLKLGEF